MTTNPATPGELKEGIVTVDQYHSELKGKYPSLDVAKNLCVVELALYKTTGGPQHEFLIAHVFDKNAQSEHRAKIERFGLGRDAQARNSSSSSSLPRGSSSSLSLTESATSDASRIVSSREVPAQDNISWLERRDWPEETNKDKAVRLSHLVIPSENPIYFYELIVLASIVHMNRPHYTLLKENCYWFAGIILAVMSRVVQKSPELHKDPRATVQMGAWHALIAIFKENNTNIVAMVNTFWEQYNNEVTKFTAQIVELQETRRLASTAGEEKARADALAEQVDEEKARANGALSRAEALAEQVDEEKARAARAISRAEALEAFMRSQGLSLPDGLTLN